MEKSYYATQLTNFTGLIFVVQDQSVKMIHARVGHEKLLLQSIHIPIESVLCGSTTFSIL